MEKDKNLEENIEEVEKPSLKDFQSEMNEFSQNDEYKIDGIEEFIDTEGGEVIDKENLTPMDAIRAVAKKLGQTLKDPNPSCKHCYGRGWVGKEANTGMPYPCNCIKTEEDKKKEKESFNVDNRKFRRNLRKLRNLDKFYRKKFKNKGHEEFLASTSASDVLQDDFMKEGSIPTSAGDVESHDVSFVKSPTDENCKFNAPKIKTEEARQRKTLRLKKVRKEKAKAKKTKKIRKINRKKNKRKA